MAAIAATDVAYTIQKTRKEESGNKIFNILAVFGDGTLTYPAGGIPLTGSKMGCPNNVISVILNNSGSANGFLYKYDHVNNKIRIYQGDNTNAAAAPGVELTGSATPASATLALEVTGY